MVTRGSNSPYKLSGVVSSFPGNQSFRKDLAECHSVTAHRQHHSSKLHQSESGHSLQASVPISYFNVDMVQRAKISLLAEHVPGQLNAQANEESRTVKD